MLYRWDGAGWVKIGDDVDMADFYTKTELNTMFDQTNAEIALRATKEETSILKNRMETAEGKLTVQSGQITSAVSNATSALTTVNNLKIGGRNYVLKSNQTIERSTESPDQKWMTSIAMSPDFVEDCKGKSIVFSMSHMCDKPEYGDTQPWIGFQIVYVLEDGTTTSRYWNWAHLFPAGTTKPWIRTVGTGLVPDNAVSVQSAMCTIQRGFESGLIRIRQPMVELSTKASDYRPAPEDDENRLTTAESRITQNATNINLKVSQSIYNQEKIYRSATAPASPTLNMLWLNTATSPYVLSRWTGSAWVTVGADKVIASGINITPNDITLRTSNFVLQLLDPKNSENVLMEMRANGNVGFKELYADTILSPSVINTYTGYYTLYVDPGYTGNAPNVYKSVREACEALSGKYLRQTVYINFLNNTTQTIYENAGIKLEGVCGPGRIWLSGANKNKTIIGYISIENCSVAIFIDWINIRESRPLNSGARNTALVHASHSNLVTMQHCTLNGNNTTTNGFLADYTLSSMWDNIIRNVTTGYNVNSHFGVVEASVGNLTNALWCNSGIMFCVGTVPTGGRVKTKNGQIYESGSSTAPGTTTPGVTVEQTGYFSSTARTYRGGIWRTDATDMVQGAYNDSGYNTAVPWNYGCCWFGTLRGAVGGKTVRAASLNITRKTGSGSSGIVYMYLYGISNASASGTPALTYNMGIVGYIGRGQSVTINMPVALVQGLVNGTYGGLCLYEPAYNFGRSPYSSNYSRYDPPTLYVVYS